GAALGVFAILVVIPRIDSIGGLALLVAAGTLPAAVIATGSARISYAGWQIAFAFYLCVLHGFSPSTDMVVARDRLIGILLGNAIVSVVFANLWPVPVQRPIAQALANATKALSLLLTLDGTAEARRRERDRLVQALYEQLARARRLAGLAR